MRLISSICAIENMGIPAGSTGTEVAGGICTRALKALISAIMSAIVVIVAAVSCALGSTGAAWTQTTEEAGELHLRGRIPQATLASLLG
jgi:hypothetical protein